LLGDFFGDLLGDFLAGDFLEGDAGGSGGFFSKCLAPSSAVSIIVLPLLMGEAGSSSAFLLVPFFEGDSASFFGETLLLLGEAEAPFLGEGLRLRLRLRPRLGEAEAFLAPFLAAGFFGEAVFLAVPLFATVFFFGEAAFFFGEAAFFFGEAAFLGEAAALRFLEGLLPAFLSRLAARARYLSASAKVSLALLDLLRLFLGEEGAALASAFSGDFAFAFLSAIVSWIGGVVW